MKTIRLAKHSLRAMRRYKLRTSFMMLGSLIGIAALTFVISAGQAAQRRKTYRDPRQPGHTVWRNPARRPGRRLPALTASALRKA